MGKYERQRAAYKEYLAHQQRDEEEKERKRAKLREREEFIRGGGNRRVLAGAFNMEGFQGETRRH